MDTIFRHVRKQLNAEWHRISAESIESIAKQGLNLTHGKLVVNIAEKGPLKSSEAAELLGITNGAVTGIVDKLIQLGYVERRRSEEDRRIVMLHITQRAHGLICEIDRVRDKIMLKLFRNLTEEEIEFAIRLFKKLANNLESDFQS
ncbi:MarR family winged helix-turn-helix transcriptional regulator [Paenibacillus thailandensis]|jgi:DNA-binding MarR family transcriptional regulator|uniref:MarR family winged helix-turn-helix transcriptional regulator n=1 Tax=Paenibacillus thailandensis TaxID=393250 RepID=A0ABW5QQL7_9BACL